MRQAFLICSVATFLLIGCGPAEFAGTTSAQSKATASGTDTANGSVAQGAGTQAAAAAACVKEKEDAAAAAGQSCDVNEIENECDDETGNVPAMTTDQLLALIKQDPAKAAADVKELECYISHGGGHGIDLCMTGDKSKISGLTPIQIEGNQICVPLATVEANATLFAGAMTGRCQ